MAVISHYIMRPLETPVETTFSTSVTKTTTVTTSTATTTTINYQPEETYMSLLFLVCACIQGDLLRWVMKGSVLRFFFSFGEAYYFE
jgi:hypothetical protein